jgi:tetratricopeptide (TPR) repeat protein
VRLYERIIGRAPAPDPAPKTARRGARPAPAPAVVPSGPPPSLELAVEARWRLAQIARADGQTAREFELMREIFHADAAGGAARTERTKFLGATAALALAAPALEAYRGVVLVEPLQKSLKTKKAKLEEVLRAYATATEYGVAEVTTAATFHSAGVYAEFGRALMNSQRPKKLSKVEREQYDVMLEEQAFPFEEKALQLHEVNAKRAASGVYDEWVKKSFDELARMRPVRYAKPERGADASHRALAELERDTQAENAPATAWNRLGVAQRKAGHFDKARQAYEHALVVDPAAADAVLNLGILHDLYLGNAALAQELYARYLALTPAGDATVSKWVADLKNRKSDRVALDTQVAKEKP